MSKTRTDMVVVTPQFQRGLRVMRLDDAELERLKERTASDPSICQSAWTITDELGRIRYGVAWTRRELAEMAVARIRSWRPGIMVDRRDYFPSQCRILAENGPSEHDYARR